MPIGVPCSDRDHEGAGVILTEMSQDAAKQLLGVGNIALMDANCL